MYACNIIVISPNKADIPVLDSHPSLTKKDRKPYLIKSTSGHMKISHDPSNAKFHQALSQASMPVRVPASSIPAMSLDIKFLRPEAMKTR